MNERFVRFGERRQLLGTLTLPAEMTPGRPVVLLPNTGVEHRVGPNRLHVYLCRAIAAAGFAALRVDLAGMGDSAPDPGGAQHDSTADLQAAMHELTRQGLGARFIAFGICSGAHDAHRLALADERVVAAAFIDGYTYSTLRYHLHYWAQRLADPVRIARKLRRRLRAVIDEADREGFEAHRIEYYRQPQREQMARDLSLFMRRHLPLWFLYTGQLQHEYNYRAQLIDAFPLLRRYPHISLHHLQTADHTFSRVAMRSQLNELLLQWLGGLEQPSSVAAT